MDVFLSPFAGAGAQFFDNSGVILSGGKIYTYAGGTTTPEATYTDSTGTTPHANPIILDSAGRVPGGEIWLVANQPYKFVLETATGILLGTYDAIPGIGAIVNADNVRYDPPYPNAVATTVEAKLAQYVSAKDFGAVGDGIADDTSAIMAFIDAGGGYVPPGRYRLTSSIEVPAGTVIFGEGVVYKASAPLTAKTVFYIDHFGQGFTVTGAAGARLFKGIATERNQPTPGLGWAPNANDWDFFVSGATDVSFEDVMLLNPTKGVICTNGGGRFSFTRVWGQPLEIGIQIDTSYDVSRLEFIHFWPFWADDVNVHAYTVANATAIYSKRNDNPVFSNIFTIFYAYGLRIGNWSGGGAGTTQQLYANNLGFDAGRHGYYVDSDSNGHTSRVYGMYAFAYNADPTGGADQIAIEGTNANITIWGAFLADGHGSAVSVNGAGSSLTIDDLFARDYNQANVGKPGIQVSATAFAVILQGNLTVALGAFGAPQYSGNNDKIRGVARRNYVPTIASSTGTLTTVTVNSAEFDYANGIVNVALDFTIVDNGTGSGSLTASLPILSSPSFLDIGFGREVAVIGATTSIFVPNNSLQCTIVKFDNSYPGGTGHRIISRLTYRAVN